MVMVFVVASSAVIAALVLIFSAFCRGPQRGVNELAPRLCGSEGSTRPVFIIQALEIQVPLAGSPIGRGHFSSSVCQPGLVQRPCCQTKISVTRLEHEDRFPSTSIST